MSQGQNSSRDSLVNSIVDSIEAPNRSYLSIVDSIFIEEVLMRIEALANEREALVLHIGRKIESPSTSYELAYSLAELMLQIPGNESIDYLLSNISLYKTNHAAVRPFEITNYPCYAALLEGSEREAEITSYVIRSAFLEGFIPVALDGPALTDGTTSLYMISVLLGKSERSSLEDQLRTSTGRKREFLLKLHSFSE